MNRRITIIVAAAMVLLGLAVVAVGTGAFKPRQQAALVGGPFVLADQTGRRVDEKALKGKWSAVFFGYTYCPDVCPGTLQALTTVSDQLGPRAAKFQIVFVSVDPGRDTPAVIKGWLDVNKAPPGTLGLTGTPEQTATVVKAYKVFVQKQGDGANYLMDHSAYIYLMDPKGRFVKVIPYNLPPDEITTQTVKAMRGD
jgi:protein SCO1/2